MSLQQVSNWRSQIIDDCATDLKLCSSPHCRQTSTYLYTHNTETAQHVEKNFKGKKGFVPFIYFLFLQPHFVEKKRGTTGYGESLESTLLVSEAELYLWGTPPTSGVMSK